MIRLNPIPWLFAPGIALAGYLVGDVQGAVRALVAWLVIVTLATVWVIVRRRLRPDDAGAER